MYMVESALEYKTSLCRPKGFAAAAEKVMTELCSACPMLSTCKEVAMTMCKGVAAASAASEQLNRIVCFCLLKKQV